MYEKRAVDNGIIGTSSATNSWIRRCAAARAARIARTTRRGLRALCPEPPRAVREDVFYRAGRTACGTSFAVAVTGRRAALTPYGFATMR